MKKVIKKIKEVKKLEAECNKVMCEQRVLIAETNENLGREDLNTLASKVNEIIRQLNK